MKEFLVDGGAKFKEAVEEKVNARDGGETRKDDADGQPGVLAPVQHFVDVIVTVAVGAASEIIHNGEQRVPEIVRIVSHMHIHSTYQIHMI